MFCRLLGSVTFEQQRHEGDVRRTEFGHSQPVSPVVAWRILQWVEKEQEEHHYLNVFGKYMTLYRTRAKHNLLPSASRRHSKFFLSYWGFSGRVIYKKGKTTFTIIVNFEFRDFLTSQVLWSLCTALLPKPNMTAKNELRFFCSFNLWNLTTWGYTGKKKADTRL